MSSSTVYITAEVPLLPSTGQCGYNTDNVDLLSNTKKNNDHNKRRVKTREE